jgi:MFS family permease
LRVPISYERCGTSLPKRRAGTGAESLSHPQIPPIAKGDPRLRVGTLQYTKAGLVWVFLMLLWGDLCFTLMETVAPSIVPLRLNDLGASDFLLMMVTTTIPMVIGTLTNPFISVISDRHRGRFGRRIPFLLIGLPFVCGALVLMAYSTEIGLWLHAHFSARTGWSKETMMILAMAVLWIIFTALNVLGVSAFYYIFNDVVPPLFLSRFFGLLRMVSYLATAAWNLFIFPHALTHMKLVFLCAAAVYFAGFMTLCLGIKEGKYPPADPMGAGFWAKVRTYAKECLCAKLYVYMFGLNIFWRLSWACQTYVVLLQRNSLGLTLAQIGFISAGRDLVSAVLSYPMGMLSDRIHPMKVMLWARIGLVAIVPLDFIWVYWNHLPPRTSFYVLIVLSAIQLPIGAVFTIAGSPCAMRLLPKSRYGQFGSFDATVMAICSIGGTALGGLFMAGMRRLYPDNSVYGANFCYRMMPVWRLPFLCVALMFLFMMFREWKRLGGPDHYKVPGFPNEESMEPPMHATAAEEPAPAK